MTFVFAHSDAPVLAGAATAPAAARRTLLLRLAAGLLAVDATWSLAAHLDVAYGAYLPVILLALALFAGSHFYQTRRPDPRLSAMLFGAGFLCLFSASASVLNYCLLTVAGAPMDQPLAALDRAIGFDWPRAMAAMAGMPLFNAILYVAYATMLPQVALLTVVLARRDTFPNIYSFCLAVATGALLCIAVWTIAPSFGAIAVYEVPPGWHLPLALDKSYARELAALLAHGPGRISPHEVRGLIGFPSYHAVLALLVAFYAWRAPWLRWPALVLNLLVVVATPIQGGHHLVDVLAGVPVAALALYGAGELRRRAAL